MKKRSKEAIAHQTKWEMEEAAKLKAKLDLVETRQKPSYGRLPRQTTEKELPEGLVPYSAEREDVLKKLREALAQVDRRMIELFRGKPDDVGERMDHLTGNGARLLDAPKEPNRPAKSKR